MKLIFGALAIVAALMIMIAGSSVYWLTASTLKEVKQDSVAALATGLAYSISSQMQLFEQTVKQMAADEDVIKAIESGDAALIEKTTQKIQKFLPVALKVRLLPPTVNQVDERARPFMGYADLEMVKRTLTEKQSAIIQGEGNNRHLAMTASIKKGDQAIGVVLASLKFDFIQEILNKAPINDNFIEITQASVTLGSAGDLGIKGNDSLQVAIINTPWLISYVTADIHKISNISILIGLIITLTILSCVALFFGYQHMTVLLKSDQNKVLEAVKDLMTGKQLGSYEVKLYEMQVIISTLLQFKRILDNKQGKDGTHEPPAVRLEDSDLFHTDEMESDAQPNQSTGGLFKKKSQLNP